MGCKHEGRSKNVSNSFDPFVFFPDVRNRYVTPYPAPVPPPGMQFRCDVSDFMDSRFESLAWQDKEDASADLEGSDAEDSVTGLTSSKRSNTRTEAARGPARKAACWLKSLVKKGIMPVEQKDALLPDERKRLYDEMIQKRDSSSSLTKDILTHHQQQSAQLVPDGLDLIHEMLTKGVWHEDDVKDVRPSQEESDRVNARILTRGCVWHVARSAMDPMAVMDSAVRTSE